MDAPKLVEAFSFVVPGKPEQRGSKVSIVRYNPDGSPMLDRRGKVLTFVSDDNKRSRAYMTAVKKAARVAMRGRELIETPVVLSARFYFQRPKSVHYYQTKARHGELRDDAPRFHAQSPDLAKLLRCVEDAMTGEVWTDDKLVYKYRDAGRQWTEGEPFAIIRVYLHAEDFDAWEAKGRF